MKKSIKILSLILCLVTVMGALCACKGEEVPKRFTEHGCTITLTNYYKYKSSDVYDFCYEGDERIVLGKKETFTALSKVGISSGSSLVEYANKVISNNQLGVKAEKIGGLVTFSYTRDVETSMVFTAAHKITYLAVVYKTGDGFWLIQFACVKDQAEKLEKDIFAYAASVKV